MNYYTHSGMFHCDEVMGFAITRIAGICNDYVRLEDTTNIPKDGLVADIGGVYDPENLLFDHHQEMLYRPDGYPYATAGLLWEEFGHLAVERLLYPSDGHTSPARDEFVARVVERVDNSLLKGIDASDADAKYNASFTTCAGHVRMDTLPDLVSAYNDADPKNQVSQFLHAANFCDEVLMNHILKAKEHVLNEDRFDSLVELWAPASPSQGKENLYDGSMVRVHRSSYSDYLESIVEKALIDDNIGMLGTPSEPDSPVSSKSGLLSEDLVMVLSEAVPWRELVHKRYPDVKYVIMPNVRPETTHSMFAVSIKPSSRALKQPIERPEWFDGFIHNGKWIAAGSFDELMNLAYDNLTVLKKAPY